MADLGRPESVLSRWTDVLNNSPGGPHADLQRRLSEFPELAATLGALPAAFDVEEGSMLWLDERGQIGGEVQASWSLPGGPLGAVSFSLYGEERLCEWDNLWIERPYRERGLATRFFRALVALCSELGLTSITLRAEDAGRYCWASLGFDFEHPDERLQVVEAAEEFADRLGRQVDLSEVEHAVTLATLPGTVTRDAYAAAGGVRQASQPKQMKLGRALLLGPTNINWTGRFEVPTRAVAIETS